MRDALGPTGYAAYGDETFATGLLTPDFFARDDSDEPVSLNLIASGLSMIDCNESIEPSYGNKENTVRTYRPSKIVSKCALCFFLIIWSILPLGPTRCMAIALADDAIQISSWHTVADPAAGGVLLVAQTNLTKEQGTIRVAWSCEPRFEFRIRDGQLTIARDGTLRFEVKKDSELRQRQIVTPIDDYKFEAALDFHFEKFEITIPTGRGHQVTLEMRSDNPTFQSFVRQCDSDLADRNKTDQRRKMENISRALTGAWTMLDGYPGDKFAYQTCTDKSNTRVEYSASAEINVTHTDQTAFVTGTLFILLSRGGDFSNGKVAVLPREGFERTPLSSDGTFNIRLPARGLEWSCGIYLDGGFFGLGSRHIMTCKLVRMDPCDLTKFWQPMRMVRKDGK